MEQKGRIRDLPPLEVDSDVPVSARRGKAGLAMVEGALLLGAVAVVQSQASEAVSALAVHPFLIVVALLSAQYGTIGGIAATVGATGFYIAGGTPQRVVGQEYHEYAMAVWQEPLSWLVIALLLGVVADHYLRTIQRSREDLEKVRRERDIVTGHHDVLADRVRRLERHIAGFAITAAPPVQKTRIAIFKDGDKRMMKPQEPKTGSNG